MRRITIQKVRYLHSNCRCRGGERQWLDCLFSGRVVSRDTRERPFITYLMEGVLWPRPFA